MANRLIAIGDIHGCRVALDTLLKLVAPDESDTVIALGESVGFRLADRSEVNANPRDTKDYADGVWTLPPVFRLKDQNRERYAAIGESDRMTIKFVKPAP